MTKNEYYSHWRDFEKLPYYQQVDDLNRFIEEDRQHWQDIHDNGCSDPFWEDGVNMNLVRNHIIAWCKKLYEIDRSDRQMDMFEMLEPSLVGADFMMDERIPPEVDDRYMAKDRKMAKGIVKAALHFD